ncbi:MAG TPA: extracellular solute-binding protein [Candidatus Limnocylindria bacterium]|jgi:iron(III) transport system substrate-binding protein|nr:extracellular solute-binding protein [Candidatus Limnocylindria bacterium]
MRRYLAAIAVSALLIGACGGGGGGGGPVAATATPTVAPTQTETADQVMARLYEAAKAEGTVAFYSSTNTDDAGKILPVFQAKFPSVKVVHTRKSGEALVQQLVTEKKAGQDLFDVVETNLFEVAFVIEQGYTQKYVTASAGDFPADARAPDGSWIAARFNNDLPGINTTKLPAGVTIKTWKDLCNPALSRKIAVEQSDVVVYSALRKILGDAEAQATLKCIAANQPSLRSGHTDMANLLAAGEFAVTLSSNGHRLAQLKYEENKPIDWAKTDPIITDVQAMALSNKPKNPNAAKLLLEWLVSPDGQRAIASTGRVPASTKVPPKYPDLQNFAKIFFVTAALRADFNSDAEFWRTTLGIK